MPNCTDRNATKSVWAVVELSHMLGEIFSQVAMFTKPNPTWTDECTQASK